MNQPSIDARAVVRAADALTTQVRRIADALSPTTDAQQTTADDGARYRLAQARNAAALHRQGLISDRQLNAVIDAGAEAPAADEDALRTTRRDSLLVLLSRAERGVLKPHEAELLRNHVEAEIHEGNTARSVARSNLRHVKALVPELEQAQAAIERVRGECAAIERDMFGAEDDGMRAAIVRILAALDGTEQPTTKEN